MKHPIWRQSFQCEAAFIENSNKDLKKKQLSIVQSKHVIETLTPFPWYKRKNGLKTVPMKTADRLNLGYYDGQK